MRNLDFKKKALVREVAKRLKKSGENPDMCKLAYIVNSWIGIEDGFVGFFEEEEKEKKTDNILNRYNEIVNENILVVMDNPSYFIHNSNNFKEINFFNHREIDDKVKKSVKLPENIVLDNYYNHEVYLRLLILAIYFKLNKKVLSDIVFLTPSSFQLEEGGIDSLDVIDIQEEVEKELVSQIKNLSKKLLYVNIVKGYHEDKFCDVIFFKFKDDKREYKILVN